METKKALETKYRLSITKHRNGDFTVKYNRTKQDRTSINDFNETLVRPLRAVGRYLATHYNVTYVVSSNNYNYRNYPCVKVKATFKKIKGGVN